MIFLDTSAIYALADQADANHKLAFTKFNLLLKSGEELLLHNYILVESSALIQSRLGLQAALLFLKDATKFETEWIDSSIHLEAEKELRKINKRGISLVDCASFIVMRRRSIETAFCFDPDFEDQGFHLY
jgi:predicted nucleic acid-binding protein